MELLERTGVPRSRRLLLAVALALSALGSLLISLGFGTSRAQAVVLTPWCADGRACFWDQPDYEGAQALFAGVWCCNEHTFDTEEWNSAKNRLHDRSIKVFHKDGGQTTIKACLDPDEERPDPGRFNGFQMQNNACNN